MKRNTMYGAALPPIDGDWQQLQTLDEYCKQSLHRKRPISQIRFSTLYKAAGELVPARYRGSLYRTGCQPRAIAIRLKGQKKYSLVFLWKYDEDGITLVTSEHPLQGGHLESVCESLERMGLSTTSHEPLEYLTTA